MFNEWKLGLEEEELTVMKVKLIGKKDGEPKTIEWNLLDFYDHETKISSMARTTGYTCTAAVNLLHKIFLMKKECFRQNLLANTKTVLILLLNI